MTPKARSDIHMNLPALQKLDSMLLVGGLKHRKSKPFLFSMGSNSKYYFLKCLGSSGFNG